MSLERLTERDIREATENVLVTSALGTRESQEFACKVLGGLRSRGSTADVQELASDPEVFSSREPCPKFLQDSYGKDVYIAVASVYDATPAEMIVGLLLTASAAKKHGARRIIGLAPHLWLSRQERLTHDPDSGEVVRQPISAEWLAEHAALDGISQMFSAYVHSPDVSVFWDSHVGKGSLVDVPMEGFIAHYLRNRSGLRGSEYVANSGEGIVFLAVDDGNRAFIDRLKVESRWKNASVIYFSKKRSKANSEQHLSVNFKGVSDNYTGSKGKLLLAFDDGIDTGGTLSKNIESIFYDPAVVELLKGPPAEAMVGAIHGWWAGDPINTQRKFCRKLNGVLRGFLQTNTYADDNSQATEFRKISRTMRLASLWSDLIIRNQLGLPLDVYAGFSTLADQAKRLAPLYELKTHSPSKSGRGLPISYR